MGVLDTLHYDTAVGTKDDYEDQLKKMQAKLLQKQLLLRQEGRPAVIAFEGWDAAGKGGAIRRMTEQMDPRGYHVWPIGAPTQEEKRHHYLWRFWNRLPEKGAFAIFDRSWYGRVLVERVEGFAKKSEWKRAYREINEFERQLVDDGATLVKIFLAITKEEQLKRFKERESNPLKMWKLGPEDWRNREKWDEYVEAAEDMFAETNSGAAPWKVVGGNRKWHARLQVLQAVVKALD